MIQVVPRSLFSWNFLIKVEDTPVAELDMSSWRERGSLSVEQQDFEIYRRGLLDGTIVLEKDGEEVASASRTSLFQSSFTLRLEADRYYIKRSFLGRTISCSTDIGQVGLIARRSWFSRKYQADLPEELSLPLKVFVIWLALLLHKRDSDRQSSGG